MMLIHLWLGVSLLLLTMSARAHHMSFFKKGLPKPVPFQRCSQSKACAAKMGKCYIPGTQPKRMMLVQPIIYCDDLAVILPGPQPPRPLPAPLEAEQRKAEISPIPWKRCVCYND